MKRIIYTMEDGTLAVIIPTNEMDIESVALKDVPEGLPYKIVDKDVIPKDRTFRDAWEAENFIPDGTGMGPKKWKEKLESKTLSYNKINPSSEKLVKVNMPKAIEIKKNMIRKERVALLQELDVQYMRALEDGNVPLQKEIVKEKQRLRDATVDPSIVNAKTPEELIAANPLKK